MSAPNSNGPARDVPATNAPERATSEAAASDVAESETIVPTIRIAAGVEYDGSRFHGWQCQPNRATVQGAVEAALSVFAQEPIKVTTAGRTDTGVHALNQVIHFDSTAKRSDFSWVRGVNAHLPPGVAIQWAKPVPDTFNARFSAFERSYDYVILQQAVKPTLLAARVGWVHTPLDIAAMQNAAARLLGQHDFSSFRSSECQAKSPVKMMKQVDVVQNGAFIHFRFTASAFLHHMVRNLVGSLIAVGRGRYPPEWIDSLLLARDRRLAAPTFMPDGLYLTRVGYPVAFDMPPPNVVARPGGWQWPD